MLLELNQWVPPAGPDAQSLKPKKAEKAPGSQKGSNPSNRNKDNIDYRKDRRREALGKRELDPIVANESTAEAFVLQAIHGDHPKCHKCPEKKEQGWTCAKNHKHGIVVEVRKQGKARQWKCHCCESKVTVIRGTIFHGTKLSCVGILLALHKIVSSRFGVSSQDIAGYLNEAGRDVSEDAAFMLMNRVRECMWEDEPIRFKGKTEIDEMLLHLEGGKRVSLMVAYNQPTRRIRFKFVERQGGKKPKANRREMLKFIRETTVPGSTILTDGDAAMPTPMEMGRKHGIVCHNGRNGRQFQCYKRLEGELGKCTLITTNRVEGKNSIFRRSFRLRNGITRHHLDRYLLEVAWRINYLHNRVESRSYEGGERRNLSLMRDVLAGATRRKMVLRDLRGKPQRKRDRILEKNRTAPVSDPAGPQQRPLMPPGPIVPGASQSGSGKVEVKPHQTRSTPQSGGGQVKAKPPQTRQRQMVLALWDSQPEDEQPQTVLPEETAVGSQPA